MHAIGLSHGLGITVKWLHRLRLLRLLRLTAVLDCVDTATILVYRNKFANTGPDPVADSFGFSDMSLFSAWLVHGVTWRSEVG